MKHQITIALGMTAALASSGAFAQTSTGGFTVDGYVELSYLNSDVLDETVFSGDVTIASRFGGPFGVALGLEGYSFDGSTGFAVYPMVTFDTDFGTFSVGRPRFVLDTLVDTPAVGGTELSEFSEIAVGTRSIAGITVLPDTSDVNFAGVRYDSDANGLRVALAYHRLWDTTSDVDMFSGSIGYQVGPTEFIGGFEVLQDGATRVSNYIVGVTYDEGPLNAGLTYAGVEIMGEVQVLSLWAGYEVIDGLTVTGAFRNFDTPGTDQRIYGIDAQYTVGGGAYVGAGFLAIDGGTDTNVFNVSLGYEF